MTVVIDSSDTAEEIEAKFRAVGDLVTGIQLAWARSAWQRHPGRHRYRILVNQPHPESGLPTYRGCEKCGKPVPTVTEEQP